MTVTTGHDPQAGLAGRLLVAAPTLQDPNFFRTVVLILEHTTQDGALGVVLNRPSGTGVAEVLPAWEDLASEPGVVHVGGPVSPGAAICLAAISGDPDAVPGDAFAPLPPPTSAATAPPGARLGTVDLDTDPLGIAAAVAGLRVFAGYAGWTAGQLEEEIAERAWFVLDALPGDPFADESGGLWQRVLARQDAPLRLVASMPPDPSMN